MVGKCGGVLGVPYSMFSRAATSAGLVVSARMCDEGRASGISMGVVVKSQLRATGSGLSFMVERVISLDPSKALYTR